MRSAEGQRRSSGRLVTRRGQRPVSPPDTLLMLLLLLTQSGTLHWQGSILVVIYLADDAAATRTAIVT